MAAQKKPDLRTRHRILELLKQLGPQDAQTLAQELAVSAMAVRQHLYQLQAESLIDFVEQPRPVGRPAKLWRLTEQAQSVFPDAHAGLAVDLICALTETFGKEGLDQLVQARAKQQLQLYRQQFPQRGSLRTKLEKLAELRTAEGYMAEVLEEDGQLMLIENHCPICTAATSCTGLCSAELELFQALLGKRVHVQRTEHILEGARRCAYSVSPVV